MYVGTHGYFVCIKKQEARMTWNDRQWKDSATSIRLKTIQYEGGVEAEPHANTL